MSPRRAGEQPFEVSATRPATRGAAMLVPRKAFHVPATRKTSGAPALAETSGTSRQLVPHAFPELVHWDSTGCQLGRSQRREIPPPPAPPPPLAQLVPVWPSHVFHTVCVPSPASVVPPTAVTYGSDDG